MKVNVKALIDDLNSSDDTSGMVAVIRSALEHMEGSNKDFSIVITGNEDGVELSTVAAKVNPVVSPGRMEATDQYLKTLTRLLIYAYSGAIDTPNIEDALAFVVIENDKVLNGDGYFTEFHIYKENDSHHVNLVNVDDSSRGYSLNVNKHGECRIRSIMDFSYNNQTIVQRSFEYDKNTSTWKAFYDRSKT